MDKPSQHTKEDAVLEVLLEKAGLQGISLLKIFCGQGMGSWKTQVDLPG